MYNVVTNIYFINRRIIQENCTLSKFIRTSFYRKNSTVLRFFFSQLFCRINERGNSWDNFDLIHARRVWISSSSLFLPLLFQIRIHFITKYKKVKENLVVLHFYFLGFSKRISQLSSLLYLMYHPDPFLFRRKHSSLPSDVLLFRARLTKLCESFCPAFFFEYQRNGGRNNLMETRLSISPEIETTIMHNSKDAANVN